MIVAGDNWPDATSAAPLAGMVQGPVLLTQATGLNQYTRDELTRLRPQKVYIIGSTGAISSGIDGAIKSAINGVIVERIYGASRYTTATAIATKVATLNGNLVPDKTVILVTGTNYPDALTVGSLSSYKKYPVLLTGTTLDTNVKQFLTNYGITRTIVVGGTNVIPETIFKQLPGGIRISGTDRYQTSVKFATWMLDNIPSTTIANLGIATGDNFPDALSTGPFVASLSGPGIILIDSYSSNTAVQNFLNSKKSSLNRITVLGGSTSISTSSYLKYANLIGSNYTAEQIQAQTIIDGYISKCPILAGTVVEIKSIESGYQAVAYYVSGRIIISPTHTATLSRILAHEIFHIYDWRDNNVINWGENLPPSPVPSCFN